MSRSKKADIVNDMNHDPVFRFLPTEPITSVQLAPDNNYISLPPDVVKSLQKFEDKKNKTKKQEESKEEFIELSDDIEESLKKFKREEQRRKNILAPPTKLLPAQKDVPVNKPEFQQIPPGKQTPDPNLAQFQKFLESSPLGVRYVQPYGAEYGVSNLPFIEAVGQFELALAKEFDVQKTDIVGKIFSGGKLRTTVSKVKAFMKKAKEKADKSGKSGKPGKPDPFEEYEKFFKEIGLYKGPIRGRMSGDLAAAAGKLEQQVSKKLDNPSIIGTIISPRGEFLAPVSEIRKGLRLLEKLKKKPELKKQE